MSVLTEVRVIRKNRLCTTDAPVACNINVHAVGKGQLCIDELVYMSYDVSLEVQGEIVLYCVLKLCTVISTLR